MTYDEFAERLRKMRADFLRENGRPMETLAELESVLARKLVRPRKGGLRSLKGIIP